MLPTRTNTLEKEIEETRTELSLAKSEEKGLEEKLARMGIDTVMEEAVRSERDAKAALVIIDEAIQFVKIVDMTTAEKVLAIRSRLQNLASLRIVDPDAENIRQHLREAYTHHYNSTSLVDSMTVHEERFGNITDIVSEDGTDTFILPSIFHSSLPSNVAIDTDTMIENEPVAARRGVCNEEVVRLLSSLRDSSAAALTMDEYLEKGTIYLQGVSDSFRSKVVPLAVNETELVPLMDTFIRQSTTTVPTAFDNLSSLINSTPVDEKRPSIKTRRKKSTANGSNTPTDTPSSTMNGNASLSKYMTVATKAQATESAHEELKRHLQELTTNLETLRTTYQECETEIHRLTESLANVDKQSDERIRRLEKEKIDFENTAKQTLDDTEREYEKIVTNKKVAIDTVTQTIHDTKRRIHEMETLLRKVRSNV